MDLARATPRMCPFVLAASGALLAAFLLTTSPSPGPPDPIRTTLDRPSSGAPRLDIDPASWWMPAGNTTPFVVTWVDGIPGCSFSPDWFRWSVVGGLGEGTLNASTGTTVTFVATSISSGVATLQARSAGVLACGPSASAILATAEANVTVIAPISVQNLSIDPDPIDAGGTASLEGNLSGGEPPYALRLTWGDGTVSSAGVPTAGAFAVSHSFPAGQYMPSVLATDSAGLVARATVGETLDSSDSLVAGITAENRETDVDVPTRFNATAMDEPAGSSTGWSCGTEPTAVRPQVASSTEFSCAFSQAGTGEVYFQVLPPPPRPPASATLLERVVALPTLVAVPSNYTAEVGHPCAVAFDVAGGVPPLHLDWSEIGTSLAGSLSLTTDGRVLLPLTPVRDGSLQLVARLFDSDGAVTSNATTLFVVDPALNDSASLGRTLAPWGAELALTGSVSAGVPPFVWTVTPGTEPANETSLAGSLSSVGSFDWLGSYALEGSTSVTLTIVDAAGGWATSSFDVETVAPLEGNLSARSQGPRSPGTFEIDLSLAGGLPPFRIDVEASDGTSWNRTTSSPGTTAWSFADPQGGVLGLQVVVSDALGAEREWNATVAIVPAPPSTGSGIPPALGSSGFSAADGAFIVLLALGGLAFGYYRLRRRRSRSAPLPPPDAVGVLRGIIEPADGADRATVELLAEEAGVSPELAHSTIDRLIVEGTIRSETDLDGEEVLAWSPPPRP